MFQLKEISILSERYKELMVMIMFINSNVDSHTAEGFC